VAAMYTTFMIHCIQTYFASAIPFPGAGISSRVQSGVITTT
jgi:hypothetical protein